MFSFSKLFLSFSVQFSLLIIFLIFLYIFYLRQKNVSLINKLPCTKVKFWHILGHIYLSRETLFRRTKIGVSFGVFEFQWVIGYTQLFADEGICSLWHAHKPSIFVYKANTVKAILSHSTELKKAWFYDVFHSWIGTGLLTSASKKWKQRRKMLTPTFHFDILKDFIPGINNQAGILVKVLRNRTDKLWIDIVPYITRCSLDIICETTLGVKTNSQTAVESTYVKAILELSELLCTRIYAPWYWADKLFKLFPLGKKCFKNINIVQNFTKQVISKRKGEIKRKMSDIHIQNNGNGKFRFRNRKALLEFLIEDHLNYETIDDEGIREEIDTFTFEGHDTTSMGMNWAIYLLGLHPDIQEKLQNELNVIFGADKERPVNVDDLNNMKYLECVIKETLRLFPPVPLIGRELIEDLDIQGYTVPKGTTCIILSYALHRDSKVFPNPEKFDPDRFLPENSEGRDAFAYVPFSAGPRNCIGQRFAMMEAKIVLATLFRNFCVRSLDQRDKVYVVNNMILRAENGIRVKIEERV